MTAPAAADAIMGVSLYGDLAPESFGEFERGFVTMFRLTTDGLWPDGIPAYDDAGNVSWKCAAFMMSYVVVVNWVVLQATNIYIYIYLIYFIYHIIYIYIYDPVFVKWVIRQLGPTPPPTHDPSRLPVCRPAWLPPFHPPPAFPPQPPQSVRPPSLAHPPPDAPSRPVKLTPSDIRPRATTRPDDGRRRCRSFPAAKFPPSLRGSLVRARTTGARW